LLRFSPPVPLFWHLSPIPPRYALFRKPILTENRSMHILFRTANRPPAPNDCAPQQQPVRGRGLIIRARGTIRESAGRRLRYRDRPRRFARLRLAAASPSSLARYRAHVSAGGKKIEKMDTASRRAPAENCGPAQYSGDVFAFPRHGRPGGRNPKRPIRALLSPDQVRGAADRRAFGDFARRRIALVVLAESLRTRSGSKPCRAGPQRPMPQDSGAPQSFKHFDHATDPRYCVGRSKIDGRTHGNPRNSRSSKPTTDPSIVLSKHAESRFGVRI